MSIMKVSEVECLHCRTKGACITDSDYITTVENIIVRPIFCNRCHKHWKDFYGATNDSSPVISIQRNNDNNNDKSDSANGNDTVS